MPMQELDASVERTLSPRLTPGATCKGGRPIHVHKLCPQIVWVGVHKEV